MKSETINHSRLFAGLFICCLLIAVPASGEDVHNHAQHGQAGQMHSHDTDDASPVVIQIDTGARPLVAGQPADISFEIKDKQGKAAEDLTITHERLLHVIIVSEDFSSFAHIHPEDLGPITDKMKKDARFLVQYTFPRAGRYLVAVDTAFRGDYVSKQFHVTVEGEPKAGVATSDFSRKKSFGEYVVSLKTEPGEIRAGENCRLLYEITRNGEPVRDLGRYLGVPMHLAVVKTDLDRFVHAHGDVPGAAHDHMHMHAGHVHGDTDKFGPEIESDVVFPVKGTYKIFSQVRHNGKVEVFDFMVQVQ
ncbi:MAG: hypothetical protein HQL08_01220 [Nitrospirae bacterium]|nr:hypothetical protein [Nitrospirota bacterium]